jgi:ketosteroid isomerase-like protein
MILMRTTLLTVFALVCSTLLFGAAEDEVRAAEMAWSAAVKAKDYSKLDALYAPDLVYTHSTGNVDDKASYFKSVKSGSQIYDDITHSNLRIKVYNGDTGVVTAKVRMVGKSKGAPFDNQLLMTHVWVKQGGKWQLAAHQTTRVP